MDNANPVQPLQNPGEQPNQPTVLDRVFGRQEDAAAEQGGNIDVISDNVLRPAHTECINPSCSRNGQALDDDGVCTECGFSAKGVY